MKRKTIQAVCRPNEDVQRSCTLKSGSVAPLVCEGHQRAEMSHRGRKKERKEAAHRYQRTLEDLLERLISEEHYCDVRNHTAAPESQSR